MLSYTALTSFLSPIDCFHPSSTAGQTNHNAPTESGTDQPIILGTALDLAQRKTEAVLTDPKRGTGRGWMVRARIV